MSSPSKARRPSAETQDAIKRMRNVQDCGCHPEWADHLHLALREADRCDECARAVALVAEENT